MSGLKEMNGLKAHAKKLYHISCQTHFGSWSQCYLLMEGMNMSSEIFLTSICSFYNVVT